MSRERDRTEPAPPDDDYEDDWEDDYRGPSKLDRLISLVTAGGIALLAARVVKLERDVAELRERVDPTYTPAGIVDVEPAPPRGGGDEDQRGEGESEDDASGGAGEKAEAS